MNTSIPTKRCFPVNLAFSQWWRFRIGKATVDRLPIMCRLPGAATSYDHKIICNLAGGWTNPLEKYESKWESSPNKGENKQYLKPPSRHVHSILATPVTFEIPMFPGEMTHSSPALWICASGPSNPVDTIEFDGWGTHLKQRIYSYIISQMGKWSPK